MPPKRIYLDTSAYLSAILGETESTAVTKHTNGNVILSSSLMLIETERTIIKLSRDKLISEADHQLLMQRMKQDKSGMILKDLTPDLALTGVFPAVRTPKSIDLAHLRTALWFLLEAGLDGFLTLDQGQAQAAGELALPVMQI